MCTAVHNDQDKASRMTHSLPCVSFFAATDESEPNQKSWSLPIFLRRPALRRVSISVVSGSDKQVIPLALSFQTDDMGHMYVTVSNDPHPRLMLTNHYLLALKVGEALPKRYRRTFPSAAVVEDIQEQRLSTLLIRPGASAVYECPTWATAYVRKATVEHSTCLCFQPAESDNDQTHQKWSRPLNLAPSDESVCLCDGQNVKVNVQHIGTGFQVTVSCDNEESTSQQPPWRPSRAKLDIPKPVRVALAVECLWIRIVNEMLDQVDQHDHRPREIVSLSVESLKARFTPNLTRLGGPVYNTDLTIQSCQLDNLLEDRRFDFPVIVYRKWQPASTSSVHSKDSIPLVTLSVCLVAGNGGVSIKSVQFIAQPLVMLLEDSLLYILMETVQSLHRAAVTSLSFRPSSIGAEGSALRSRVFLLPSDVVSMPVVLQELDVSPLSAFVSLRASLRLFLSSDHTPLNFERLQMKSLFAQSDVFQDTLLNHYAGGMLSKAGWLIGSLELLGSPASLLMNTGAAFRDLVLFPYEGLTRGPRSFVTGLGRGAASCVRHLSSGALSSVTGLASSISRNMERLSPDQTHIRMREEQRTQPPQRLSTGLMQGLAALGLGVLGAVAGLVDQPLRSLENITVSSPGKVAKDVAAGVGRGLVGAVAKPVAGAMELVSQTGQGLLYSAGLTEAPKRKVLPVLIPVQSPRAHWYVSNTRVRLLGDDCFISYRLHSVGETVLSLHCRTDDTHEGRDGFQYAVLSGDTLSIYKGSDVTPKTYSLLDISLSEHTVDSQLVCVHPRRPVLDGNWETDETLPVATKVERFLYSSAGQDQYCRETPSSSQSLCTFTVPDKADRHLLLTCMHALQDQT